MRSGTTAERCAFHEALEELLADEIFAGGKRHGNTKWSLKAIAYLGLLWAWGPDEGLQQRLRRGVQIVTGWLRRPGGSLTYQGFTKLLRKWSDRLVPALADRLRQRVRERSERVSGHVVIAVDGTRIEVPRTQANEASFNRITVNGQRRRRGKSRRQSSTRPTAPQVWLTVLWHVSSGLLWGWRQGPSNSSERAHLREMLDLLPEKTLLVADAGFQGYDYWSELLERGHSFLIRVAGQVRLLKGLGYVRQRGDLVYLWPAKNRRRHQPPLVLRMEQFLAKGQSLWLVTNMLDRQQLTTRQMSEIYRQRWGVEVFFRTLKQTFGCSKLRSHAPHNVALELDWSLLALWVMEAWCNDALLARQQSVRLRSTAGALRILHCYLEQATFGLAVTNFSKLAVLSDDGYERSRKSIRKWPRKRAFDHTRGPQIRAATVQEHLAAYQLQSQST